MSYTLVSIYMLYYYKQSETLFLSNSLLYITLALLLSVLYLSNCLVYKGYHTSILHYIYSISGVYRLTQTVTLPLSLLYQALTTKTPALLLSSLSPSWYTLSDNKTIRHEQWYCQHPATKTTTVLLSSFSRMIQTGTLFLSPHSCQLPSPTEISENVDQSRGMDKGVSSFCS